MTLTRTIQDASTETGVSRDTLRYYERVGILPGIARSRSGHRRFSDDDMGWIKLVQCLRATGMPIEDLQAYAELMQQGDSTAGERLRLLETHRQRIQADMAELRPVLAEYCEDLGMDLDEVPGAGGRRLMPAKPANSINLVGPKILTDPAGSFQRIIDCTELAMILVIALWAKRNQ